TAVTALSPWHIMLSRWALESNLLPFIFLTGLAALSCAMSTTSNTRPLVLASVLFGLSLYAYGSAYLAVPLFLLIALVIGARAGLFTLHQTLVASCAFVVVSAPIALFVTINMFHWHELSFAGITIPRLPVAPRFETQLAESPLVNAQHLWSLI